MHNLHFLLINADSAEDAASEAESLILDWGDENNWRSVGGIASEDGSDDVENFDGGRWGLSFLDDEDGIPKEGTYFSRAVAYLHRAIAEPVELPWGDGSTYPTFPSAFAALSGQLAAFDPDSGNTCDLWALGRNLKHLSEVLDGARARKQGEAIPQFYDWQFESFGLTDLTEQSDGAKRYLIFLDMHC
jgi:hypothetical protein